MILELCEYSLYNVIYDSEEFISEYDSIKIINDITEGLIIHKDIKLANILINRNGDIKI